MDEDHRGGVGRESQLAGSDRSAEAAAMIVLERYSAGEISAREAARELGPAATEHDVFAGMVAAHLPLPVPSSEEIAAEVAALRRLYGPHGPGSALASTNL
jgi:hypothetical protein